MKSLSSHNIDYEEVSILNLLHIYSSLNKQRKETTNRQQQ